MPNPIAKYFVLIALTLAWVAHSADDPSAFEKTNTCEQFVFVGFYAGGAGPMPSSPVNRFLKVTESDYGQVCSVANSPVGDQILSLEEKHVKAQKLFELISTMFTNLPATAIHLAATNLMADQYVPPSVQLSIQMQNGKTYDWEGSENEVPSELKGLIKEVENTVRAGQTIATKRPFAYLAAYWLDEHAVEQFRREEMIHVIKPETHSLNSSVLETLRHPFQLIPLKQRTNPFVQFDGTFRPGLNTLEISYSGKAYQIRSFSIATNNTTGVTNENK